MTIFDITTLTIMCLILVFLFLALLRNFMVYKERMRVLGVLSRRAGEDILNNNPYWRNNYKLFDTHSYTEMILKFWKPVKSFYKDIQ